MNDRGFSLQQSSVKIQYGVTGTFHFQLNLPVFRIDIIKLLFAAFAIILFCTGV